MSFKDDLFSLRVPKVCKLNAGGKQFCARTLSAKDAVDYSEFNASKPGTLSCMTRLLLLTLCNEKGERLLSDDEESQLGELPISVVRELFEGIAEFNRLGEDAVSDEKKG